MGRVERKDEAHREGAQTSTLSLLETHIVNGSLQSVETPSRARVNSALGEVLEQFERIHRRVRVIAEAAYRPTTVEANRLLEERGILIIPDIVANAGGVT